MGLPSSRLPDLAGLVDGRSRRIKSLHLQPHVCVYGNGPYCLTDYRPCPCANPLVHPGPTNMLSTGEGREGYRSPQASSDGVLDLTISANFFFPRLADWVDEEVRATCCPAQLLRRVVHGQWQLTR